MAGIRGKTNQQLLLESDLSLYDCSYPGQTWYYSTYLSLRFYKVSNRNIQFAITSLTFLVVYTPSPSRLVGLAFAAAIGVTFLVLGCALPQFNNWWPMFVLFFYVLAPVPTLISRRLANSLDSASSALTELCIFITTGIVVSSLGLPIVLAHVAVIQWGACALVLSANVVVFVTILAYFYTFGNDDIDYSMW